MDNATYFERFFEEKEIPYKTFDIEVNGTFHIMDTDIVIEGIKSAPAGEQAQIRKMLTKIDFHNAPVLPFLEHLATAMATVYEESR